MTLLDYTKNSADPVTEYKKVTNLSNWLATIFIQNCKYNCLLELEIFVSKLHVLNSQEYSSKT